MSPLAPINIDPPGWQNTNRRTIVPKKFSHCCKSSRSHNRLPNLGIQQREWESPGNLTLKVSRTSTGLRKQRLLAGTNKTMCSPRPRRKEQWPHRKLSQTWLWVSGSFWRRHGLTVACRGVRDTNLLAQVFLEDLLFGRHHCHYP